MGFFLACIHAVRASFPQGLVGGGGSLAAELIDKLTTFLRREEEKKNPLRLPRLRPSGSLSRLIESAGVELGRRSSFLTLHRLPLQ